MRVSLLENLSSIFSKFILGLMNSDLEAVQSFFRLCEEDIHCGETAAGGGARGKGVSKE